jgi:Leucine-rich repeat (LRR) protein
LPPNTKFPREEKALLERLEADGTKIHGLAYMFLDGYLYEFPEELFAHPLVLPEFNHLEIHGGSIKGIPKRIEELKALQFLKILDNKIDKVPTSIGKLIRLKE